MHNCIKVRTKKEMFCVKVKKRQGEAVRTILREHSLLSREAKVISEGDFLFFPISEIPSGEVIELLQQKSAVVLKRMFEIRSASAKAEKDDAKERNQRRIAYEIIGDIAVIEPVELIEPVEPIEPSKEHDAERGEHTEHGEKRACGGECSEAMKWATQAAEEIMRRHKNVKVVAMKLSGVEGVFRKRNIRIIAGEHRTETIHKENGCRFKLDIEKVYFNPKLATERARVANSVPPSAKEHVIDMFAGVGCFSIQIAKRASESFVTAIDINPDAIFYLRENIKLNKVSNVEAINDDVRNVYRQFENSADRIIMNLPKEAFSFLKEALTMLKNRGIIHYYTIESAYTDDEKMRGKKEVAIRRAEEKLMEYIEKAASSAGVKVSVNVINARKVRPYSPYTYILGFDLAIEKEDK